MFKSARALLVGIVAVVVVAAVVLGYVFMTPWKTADVSMPAAPAGPEAVVDAYLAALNAHDCDTAAALMISDARWQLATWCEDVARLGNLVVGKSRPEEPEWSGHAESDEVVNVPVQFELDWRRFHSDVSMPEGPTTWGYLLVRESAQQPWRIFDQGMG